MFFFISPKWTLEIFAKFSLVLETFRASNRRIFSWNNSICTPFFGELLAPLSDCLKLLFDFHVFHDFFSSFRVFFPPSKRNPKNSIENSEKKKKQKNDGKFLRLLLRWNFEEWNWQFSHPFTFASLLHEKIEFYDFINFRSKKKYIQGRRRPWCERVSHFKDQNMLQHPVKLVV